MHRVLSSIAGSKKKPQTRNQIVIKLPTTSDAKAVMLWSAGQLDDWMDHLANKVYYVYTTIRLLTMASKEKYQSDHMKKQSDRVLSLSDLMMGAVWGWNEAIREVKGFSSKWLKYDIDQELQDALLRVQPVLESLEETSSRLLGANSTWDVFITFGVWVKDVCIFFIFLLVELIHAILLFAMSVIDVILDLILDAEKRAEASAMFVNFIRWLHSQYFEAGSVLTKSILNALATIAPHLLAYLFRPWSYVIQVMVYAMRKLVKMAEDNEAQSLPAPLRVSALALRKLLVRFRSIAWKMWKPLFTKAMLTDKPAQPSTRSAKSAQHPSSSILPSLSGSSPLLNPKL